MYIGTCTTAPVSRVAGLPPPWTVSPLKPGKGPAFVRTKLRDIRTGRVIDNTFSAGAKMESVRLETKTMQYLYNDGADFYFMDTTDYDQISMSAETVGDKAQWLKENDEVTLLYAGDELISLEPKMFRDYTISVR